MFLGLLGWGVEGKDLRKGKGSVLYTCMSNKTSNNIRVQVQRLFALGPQNKELHVHIKLLVHARKEVNYFSINDYVKDHRSVTMQLIWDFRHFFSGRCLNNSEAYMKQIACQKK